MAEETLKTQSTPVVEPSQPTETAPQQTEIPTKDPEVENAGKEAPTSEKTGKIQGIAERPDFKTRFKPGQSGNPAGKPKGTLAFKTALEKWADREAAKEADGSPVTALEMITKKLVDMAKDGNVKAIEMISDRIDGKPKQSIDHTLTDERISIDPEKQAAVNEAVRELLKNE